MSGRSDRADVVIIDTGGANLGSVRYALERLETRVRVSRDADEIRSASHVIMPGVGAAAWAMNHLHESGLVDLIGTLKQPVLGICLGLQLMFESSAEGDVACLGLMSGRVKALPGGPGLRLPHMGWNQLVWQHDDPLARGFDGSEWFYFVHGYAAPAASAVAISQHGQPFAAIVRRDNFVACQFHPEKSAGAGRRLLENFLQTEPTRSTA
ncbi:imidazole glycerol phosphate synthase subunit HisH [Wenzhouxiangella sp. AB-CW3]|uniref:imidazole glycerol phosphate synthase subunit HisH n=1 Tax=Wenzhouxiangella sp. AB-CW3 TaxID=2771012 RepID=UPI00168A98C9|nr:imidazole glycerol phosphate synthase subunit HisH [Wenzhouxiangella sp. AB-CW3]QOC22540.1 imidazole glycerol phosphate synthase subunit HisH [Wenzhouxiangella sp. AB-CW3]